MISSKNTHASLLQAQIAVLVAVGLQVALGDQLQFGPKYAVAALGLLLLSIHTLTTVSKRLLNVRRIISVVLVGFISLTNSVSLFLVSRNLLSIGEKVDGHALIVSAFLIYLTNIIVFGLCYWEIATTGFGGARQDEETVDFLFPQHTLPEDLKTKDWSPTFFDYLYVSLTNATAFSPTDASPLTHRAKLLMMLQALTSLVTVALVAARAINILN
jgi:uncharacterized membrane protein